MRDLYAVQQITKAVLAAVRRRRGVATGEFLAHSLLLLLLSAPAPASWEASFQTMVRMTTLENRISATLAELDVSLPERVA